MGGVFIKKIKKKISDLFHLIGKNKKGAEREG